MRSSLFLLMVLVILAVCCSTATSAEELRQKDSATAVQPQATTRYLKGGKTTTTMSSADEERFPSQFRQYLGVLRLPSFSKLPLANQLTKVKQMFGKAGVNVFQLWYNSIRRGNNNVYM
ncbi:unnamed protein product [Phytophthora fragariaefolia]|uniref:RxLR effector protein n=1 Tax=Phytophthora fragariaefolia TaxID=1490495 RepID=A0A9W6Y739_9STRA|nr:unnamed protein product [Phytophthora fragariaefolia]